MSDLAAAGFTVDLLDRAGSGELALTDGRESLTYGDLRRRVRNRTDELELGHRSVVVLTGSNTIEFVVTYLALLQARHVPILAGDHAERISTTWSPAATINATDTVDIQHHRVEQRAVHPDLALLLSTSGTTGSPKLVRLSDENLSSNASAIASYLELTPRDRGITTLPLHYCYGLSVLHSHLLAGAGMVITEGSVVDPCFIDTATRHGVTNLAGVPHTFELIERAGADRVHLPTLRFLTQAGGRLAPDAVTRWVDRAEGWGAKFYVMYGQTEATARMAYLPPQLAHRHPSAIGVPIDGGSFSLRPVDGEPDDVGELIYQGPNVMLGYAEVDADLGSGRDRDELATGDLARFHRDDGVFEIVGRTSRFIKPFGLRVDLDNVERVVGHELEIASLAVTGDDTHLAVAAPSADPDAVTTAIAALTSLPASAIRVDTSNDLPRTASGKVDYPAIRRRCEPADQPDDPAPSPTDSVVTIFSVVLGRTDIGPADTFVGLGGDSLSYVECSVRLEHALGHLPNDWHLVPVGELTPARTPRRISRMDTTVLLRAIGICAIVSTHMGLMYFPGGAHILIAVVGFNMSRFQLPIAATGPRLRAGLRTVARTAVPTLIWIAAGMAVFGAYSLGTLALVNNYVGPPGHGDDLWHFWFIEVFVQLLVVTTLLLAIPAVRRLERRYQFAFPLVLFAASLLLRMEWAQMGDWYNLRFRTHGVAWFFLLGWLIHQSTTTTRRLTTTGLAIASIIGFFDRPQREWFIIAALVGLIWFRELPMPRLAVGFVATIAAASMWILITHFTVWPPVDDVLVREWAYVITIGVGVASWLVVEQTTRLIRRRRDARASKPSSATLGSSTALA